MLDLLKRWSELEPERCEFGNFGFQLIYQEEEYAGTLLLQLAVQEAIEARGWVWRVLGHGTHAVAWVWFNIQSSDHEQAAGTPAEALLSAYIQALKSEKR